MSFLLRKTLSLHRNTVLTAQCIRTIAPQFAMSNVAKENATVREAVKTTAKPTLAISDSCVRRLREICQDGSFLRITVEGGGCSGFQYKFDLDKELKEDDQTFGEENAKVVVDNISLEYCNGATVDYHIELIRSGFRIIANPKAEQGCSCGASFAIKLD